MPDLIDTSTAQGQKVWAELCNHAMLNLPTDTTVTFEDVDAILTWALWRYEEITAPMRAPTPTDASPEGLAIAQRITRLEDFAQRLAGLLSAAGQVLDAAKLIEQEHLRRPT